MLPCNLLCASPHRKVVVVAPSSMPLMATCSTLYLADLTASMSSSGLWFVEARTRRKRAGSSTFSTSKALVILPFQGSHFCAYVHTYTNKMLVCNTHHGYIHHFIRFNPLQPYLYFEPSPRVVRALIQLKPSQTPTTHVYLQGAQTNP